MEILPLGPVVIIDTAGVNDNGELGKLRTDKTKIVLDKTDIAVLVVDSTVGIQKEDEGLIAEFKNRKIPYIVVFNKSDLTPPPTPLPQGAGEILRYQEPGKSLFLSAKTGEGMKEWTDWLKDQVKEWKQK